LNKEDFMKSLRFVALVLALSLALGSKPGMAEPDEYDDSQSNPFRVAAYLLHPAGFILEWIVFRPLHFLVSSTEPLEAFFGHRPHPPVISEPRPYPYYGTSPKVPLKQPSPPPAKVTAAPEPPKEVVRVVEVPVERIVVKEVPKIVEVERLVIPHVAFHFDSADLTELGRGEIYLAAQRLKEKSNMTIAIEGHTDDVGGSQYNEKLGMRRAETVMKELASLGVDPARMSAASLGETKPLIGQETGWARAVNRRVEFQVKGL
jgi:outer membrane protein OmpA-like peptidoglycan-associated protein